MNASAGGKGLIIDSLLKVKIITPDGEIKELSKKECELRGRGSLLKDRKTIENKSYLATYDEIKDNDYNIYVNSYLKVSGEQGTGISDLKEMIKKYRKP